ncbi:TetR/AcrR family transcriptional regulator [Paraburkholderia sp.]|uniref:TetR/AcrR family transcriptional regulator n=1 Tax=Paraburkholderia sp. TaxID=1926495 RepID=UPI003D6E3ECF
MSHVNSPPGQPNARRSAILAAAIGVFARFGYRKTSMDDVATAVNISRQALYLHFSSKEVLFRATVEFALEQHVEAATDVLDKRNASVKARLVAAIDAWVGQYIGQLGPDALDLQASSSSMAADVLTSYGGKFEAALAEVISTEGIARSYAVAKLSARDLARSLHLTAQGAKQASRSHEEFVEAVEIAVLILLNPSAGGKKAR